jgi:hypothetical protein
MFIIVLAVRQYILKIHENDFSCQYYFSIFAYEVDMFVTRSADRAFFTRFARVRGFAEKELRRCSRLTHRSFC